MKKYLPLLLLISLSAMAIPEKDYATVWAEKVLPHFSGLSSGEIETADGVTLRFHYSIKSEAKKTIVILPGRAEPTIKYAEVIYDLESPLINFFVLDHRGQGESERLIADHQKGYVGQFQDYVDDLSLFMKTVVLPQTKGTEHLLLAHSMGGAVSVHYLAQNPGIFKKAFLNAPMLKINTKPYAEIIAKIVSAVLMKAGRSLDYAPDRGPYVYEEDTFEVNDVTHSEARFDMTRHLFRDYPNLIEGGATVQWVSTSLKATARIQNLGPKIKIPVFITQAGVDEYVKNVRQDSFCRLAPDCQRVIYPQAFHELLMEKDAVRDDVLKHIKEHFQI